MPELTRERALSLGGPPWLHDYRELAFEYVESLPFPQKSEEIWRYSRIADLDLSAFELATEPSEIIQSSWDLDQVDAAARVVLQDGHLRDVEIADGVTGLTIEVARSAKDLDGCASRPVDHFSALNAVFAATPVIVTVDDGVDLGERPIIVSHYVAAEASASFPRVSMRLGANAKAVLLEVQTSQDVNAVIAPVTELQVGAEGHLRYQVVQDLGPRIWQLGWQVADIGPSALLQSNAVALGGGYARLRIDTRMSGDGAHGDLLALYLGGGNQMLDFRTVQDHNAPNTTSDLLFKGAVDDASHSIYTGTIRIAKSASGVEANQTNRNIKLSDDAWAESVPNLEIQNNDVRCSHASAVGPIDEDQRFYLESRGVPPEIAERLVVTGFFADLVARLPVVELRSAVQKRVVSRLAGDVKP